MASPLIHVDPRLLNKGSSYEEPRLRGSLVHTTPASPLSKKPDDLGPDGLAGTSDDYVEEAVEALRPILAPTKEGKYMFYSPVGETLSTPNRWIYDETSRPMVMTYDPDSGENMLFYKSSGGGEKGYVPRRRWYPVFGQYIRPDTESKDLEWLNKTFDNEILHYYGNPVWARQAELLNKYLGDVNWQQFNAVKSALGTTPRVRRADINKALRLKYPPFPNKEEKAMVNPPPRLVEQIADKVGRYKGGKYVRLPRLKGPLRYHLESQINSGGYKDPENALFDKWTSLLGQLNAADKITHITTSPEMRRAIYDLQYRPSSMAPHSRIAEVEDVQAYVKSLEGSRSINNAPLHKYMYTGVYFPGTEPPPASLLLKYTSENQFV